MAGKSKGFGRINNELDRIAAISRRRRLTAEEIERLNELVKETRAILSSDNSKMFRRLHQRAKLIRKGKTAPVKAHSPKPARRQPEGLRSILPAGLVASPGLDLAQREVLGGLPSSRRRH